MIGVPLALGLLLSASAPASEAVAAAAGAAAAVVARAPDAAADFDAAVAAYRAGDHVRALDGFAALAAVEPDAGRRAVLHANAGTAAARAERTGEAVWHLLMATRLQPADVVARSNLQRVLAAAGGAPTEASHFTDALAALPLRLTPAATRLAAGLLVGVGLLVAALWRLFPARAGLAWLAALLVAAPLAFAGWSRHAWSEAAREAVVLGKVVAARAEPQDDGLILFRVAGGTRVRRDEQRGDWSLVETAEGGRGWMPGAQVRALAP